MRLLIGIPAYNEEKTITSVIESLPKNIKGIKKIDILVVNDGSTDRTAALAQQSGALVLSHLLNRGLGGALKTIFAYAKLKKYDILVTFDADAQHKSSDIKKALVPVLKKRKDIVIGTRWKEKKEAPVSRLIINIFANIATLFFYGVVTSDSQSGFRVFGKKAIDKIKLQTDGMEVSSEIFKEIKRNSLRYGEVPIDAVYTDYSKTKGQKLSNAPNVFIKLFLRLFR